MFDGKGWSVFLSSYFFFICGEFDACASLFWPFGDVCCSGLMLWHRNYLLHLELHSLLYGYGYYDFEFGTYGWFACVCDPEPSRNRCEPSNIKPNIESKKCVCCYCFLVFCWLGFLWIFARKFPTFKLISNGRENCYALIKSHIKCLWCNWIVRSFRILNDSLTWHIRCATTSLSIGFAKTNLQTNKPESGISVRWKKSLYRFAYGNWMSNTYALTVNTVFAT